MIKRIKQFYRAISASITDKDILFINNYLNPKENELFFKLRVSEQYHSLQVAYGCHSSKPNNTTLIKAALLHDIGKLGSNLTTINKSLVVIVKRLGVEEKWLPVFLRKALNYQLQHPKHGYYLLKEIQCREEILQLVKNHHQEGYQEDDINLLRYYDEEN